MLLSKPPSRGSCSHQSNMQGVCQWLQSDRPQLSAPRQQDTASPNSGEQPHDGCQEQLWEADHDCQRQQAPPDPPPAAHMSPSGSGRARLVFAHLATSMAGVCAPGRAGQARAARCWHSPLNGTRRDCPACEGRKRCTASSVGVYAEQSREQGAPAHAPAKRAMSSNSVKNPCD